MIACAFLSTLVALAPLDVTELSSLPSDPPPAMLTHGSHYWIGNENHLDVFAPHVEGLGGVHVGVGAEQNWTFAGWSHAEALVLVDFDEAIGDLHRVYMAALRTATTPQEFLALWKEHDGKALAAAVTTDIKDAALRERALRVLRVARALVVIRLENSARRYASRNAAWFLSDDAQYAWVRNLVVEGRVFPVRGDLTKQGTLPAIAAAVRRSGQPLRTFYLSNAEEYFRFGDGFRATAALLPFDEHSVVLRTVTTSGSLPHVDSDPYHYNVQSGASFAALLADKTVVHSSQLARWGTPTSVAGVTTLSARSASEARDATPARRAGATTPRRGGAPAPMAAQPTP